MQGGNKSEYGTHGRKGSLCYTAVLSHPCHWLICSQISQHLWTNQVSPGAKVSPPMHLQNVPQNSCQLSNPVNQEYPLPSPYSPPPPHPGCAGCVPPLLCFPLSFLSLVFTDFLSIQVKAAVLNNDEMLPSTLPSDSLIVSASLEFFKYFLFIVIKRDALIPGALCGHLG